MNSRHQTNTPVLLDPGHGGTERAGRSTPYGARGQSGTVEKALNLDMARRVAGLAPRRFGLTRNADVALSLGSRCALARRLRPRAFVSLHTNAGPSGRQGSELFVHPRAGRSSHRLASTLAGSLRSDGRSVSIRRDVPLAVLHPDHLPRETAAVLVEMDYLSDPSGLRTLTDPASAQRFAGALGSGLETFLSGGARPLATGQSGNEIQVGAPGWADDVDAILSRGDPAELHFDADLFEQLALVAVRQAESVGLDLLGAPYDALEALRDTGIIDAIESFGETVSGYASSAWDYITSGLAHRPGRPAPVRAQGAPLVVGAIVLLVLIFAVFAAYAIHERFQRDTDRDTIRAIGDLMRDPDTRIVNIEYQGENDDTLDVDVGDESGSGGLRGQRGFSITIER